MSTLVLTNAKIWLGGYDFSGRMNAAALRYGAELVDVTAFGDDTRKRLGGLKTVQAQCEGFWDGTDLDPTLFADVGLADVPMSFAATPTEGDTAFSFQAILGRYQPEAPIGDALKFSVEGEASQGPLVRGSLLLAATKTASGNGTAFQLGAVGSTQYLYAALHVTAVAGSSPTLDVKVQSDNASNFPSPTDRITFAQKTAIGSEWATRVAGAITDEYWRINYTIGGSGGPSFAFAVVVGIQ